MMNVLFETRPMLALCFLEIFYKVVLASKTKRSDTIVLLVGRLLRSARCLILFYHFKPISKSKFCCGVLHIDVIVFSGGLYWKNQREGESFRFVLFQTNQRS